MALSLSALVWALLVGGSLGGILIQRPEHLPQLAKTSPVKYFITGEKDADGHWTEQVKLEHGEEDWHIDVDHMTLEVGGGDPKVKISATFSAKSPTLEQTTDTPADSSEPDESARVIELFPRSHRDWYGAQSMCEEWGGHLAIPDSKTKLRQLTTLLNNHVDAIGETTAAFLGFSDLKEEGHFVTVLGKPLFSGKWSPHWFRTDQPDDDKAWTKEGEDCGSLRTNGGLNDVPCRYNLPFICEKAVVEEETGNTVAREDNGEPRLYEEGKKPSQFGVRLRQVGPAVRFGVDPPTLPNHRPIDADFDGRLHLFSNKLDWFDAKEACVEWGGHLAIPDSEAKLARMIRMLGSTQDHPFYTDAFVGFNDIDEEGQFVTIFGKPVFDSSADWSPSWFSPTQPDDDKSWTDKGEDCGGVNPAGGLNDLPCRYHLPYFCEKSPHAAAGTTQAAAEEEDLARTGLELIYRDDFNWFQAFDYCNTWGGHLAIPNSAVKMRIMMAQMKLFNVPAAFLGFGDQREEGNFVTIFGEPVFSQTSWSPHWWRDDQPDNDQGWFPDGENCGSLRSDGGLNDVPCRHTMPFICEKRLTGSEGLASSENHLGNVETTIPVQSSEEDSFAEDKLSQIITPFQSLPTLDDTPIGVQSNEEDSFAENKLSQIITPFQSLPTLDDTPIGVQSSEEDSFAENKLSQIITPFQSLPTLDDTPKGVQRSEEDLFAEDKLSQIINPSQSLPTLDDTPIGRPIVSSWEDLSLEELLSRRIPAVQEEYDEDSFYI